MPESSTPGRGTLSATTGIEPGQGSVNSEEASNQHRLVQSVVQEQRVSDFGYRGTEGDQG